MLISFQDLRETYENQMDENKKEFVKMYDDKLKNLQDRLDAERTNMAGKNQEVRELSTKVVALTSKNSELESSNASLQRRTAELQVCIIIYNFDDYVPHVIYYPSFFFRVTWTIWQLRCAKKWLVKMLKSKIRKTK